VDGSHYLIPEEGGVTAGSKLTLYEADDFPYGWSKRVDLVTPNHHTEDHLVFRWQSRWWAVIGDWSGGNDIYAYYSDELATPSWMPNEGNPIVSNRPEATRPAGRHIVRDDHITAFFQDCRETYGHKVRAYEITELSPDSYKDQERPESPVLEPQGTVGWDSGRMHHIDPWYTGSGWVCAVDGDITERTRALTGDRWSIGVYTTLW